MPCLSRLCADSNYLYQNLDNYGTSQFLEMLGSAFDPVHQYVQAKNMFCNQVCCDQLNGSQKLL